MDADFFLMSSIGGLFEGQALINSESNPKPLRPYGKLKLSQEGYLQSKDNIQIILSIFLVMETKHQILKRMTMMELMSI